jgi:hypothetical protein
MSWWYAFARLLVVGVVLSPAPPVDGTLPSREALEEARETGEPPAEASASEAQGLRVMRGRVESVDPENGRVRVGDTLGARSLVVGSGTLVVTPRGEEGMESVTPGDEVRATFDAQGRLDVLEVLPAPREEAPGRSSKLPRITPGAPNPSAPDPHGDRAPGDVPGNTIPHRSDGD